MHLRFGETESAFDYMMATREYLEQHGKPLAFYSDKHGIFRVNNGGSTTTGVTQFGRVLSELGIELICANSPQAKGRVERANQTLQDRLIKDMCLEGISSIEAANAWLDTFIADFNRRFARPAKYPKDLHRTVAESNEELDDIFAWQELRKLSKTLTFRYDKMIYLVETTEKTLVSLATNSQSMTIHWHSNTVTVHSNIRCSTNWNVSTRGKSLITSVLGLF